MITHTVPQTDYIQQFLDFLTANDCEPFSTTDIIADDERRYYRLAQDKPGSKKGSYSLKIDNEFAVGWCYNHRLGEKFSFTSKSSRKLSAEEKAAFKARIAAEKKKRDAEEQLAYIEAAKEAERRWKAAKSADGNHPYLTRKQTGAHGLRQEGENLLISMSVAKKIVSLQTIEPDGDKLFLTGGKKKGAYFSLAKKSEIKDKIVIGEGFATCASIKEITGLPVICAFDAGNLEPVAKAMRLEYPSCQIVVAADNDIYTKINGKPYNTGMIKAKAACIAVSNTVMAWPEFNGNSEEKACKDFNDAAIHIGREYVKERIISAGVGTELASVNLGMQTYASTNESAPQDTSPLGGDFGLRFKILGYNHGLYYYFPFQLRQIVALSASAHTMQNLLQLEDFESWDSKFGMDSGSATKIALYAANALIQTAKKRGVFQEEDSVRGSGTWEDNGRYILNAGDALYINGQRKRFDEIESEFTYVAAAKLVTPADLPLGNSEANKLRTICETVTWENKLSGSLLAGWLVVAPICAALEYRPHIYIQGQPEAGKSTVMDRIIKAVIGRFGIYVHGGTTEPALRELMGYDARPLIYDEAEPSPTMDSVVFMARRASTGSVIKKFGRRPFKARFCACLGAINPPVNKLADETRISFMKIKKNTKPDAMEDFEKLLAMIDTTINKEFSSRLLARTLKHIDVLMENIKVFQKAARKVLGSARAGQQIGTMIAGLYLLSKTDIISAELAEKWVREYDWAEHTAINQESEPARLVQHITSAIVRMQVGGAPKDITVGEMITATITDSHGNENKVLRQYGIAAKDGFVDIANKSQNLAKLLRGTEWEINWSRTLSDYIGAEKKKIAYFMPGFKTSAVRLPVAAFIGEDEPATQEQEQEVYYGNF